MKLHLLSFYNPAKPLNRQIEMMQESATKRGHELEVVYAKECILEFVNKKLKVFVKEKNITNKINVMFVKASFSGCNIALHMGLIQQFELAGVNLLNKYRPIIKAKNKVETLQTLKINGIPTPKSYVVRSPEYIDLVTGKNIRYPVIIKTMSGSGGIGVAICESKRSLHSLVEMIVREEDSSGPLIVQEYIRESKGKDIRIFIVGNKIIAAMERIATKKGEFRSNFTKGGKVRVAGLSAQEKRISLVAAKACGLDIAGVDLIRSRKGPQILEVNANPGLEGITQATGKDIAGEIIDYMVKRAKRGGRTKKVLKRVFRKK